MTHREFIYLRKKRFKVVHGGNHVFKINKPGCPICSGKLTVTVNEWEQDKWGWIPTGIELECTTYPGIDSEECIQWLKWHYSQPYSDWLPLSHRIESAMYRKVRFATLKDK